MQGVEPKQKQDFTRPLVAFAFIMQIGPVRTEKAGFFMER